MSKFFIISARLLLLLLLLLTFIVFRSLLKCSKSCSNIFLKKVGVGSARARRSSARLLQVVVNHINVKLHVLYRHVEQLLLFVHSISLAIGKSYTDLTEGLFVTRGDCVIYCACQKFC